MKIYSLGQISPAEKSDILSKHRSLYNGYRTMQPEVSNTQPLYVYDVAGDKEGITVSNKGDVKRYTNVGINEQVSKKEVCSECGGKLMEGECMECGWKGDMDEHAEDGDPQYHRIKNMKEDDDEEGEDKGPIDTIVDKGKEVGSFLMSNPEIIAALENDEHIEGIDDVEDLHGKFDYVEKDEELEETEQGNPYADENPAYDFVSGGPGKAFREGEEDDDEFEMHSAWEDDDDDEVMDYLDSQDGDEEEGEFDIDDYDFDPKEKSWDEIKAHTDSWDEIDEDLKESFISQKNRINEMMSRMGRYN